ncbi:MAG: ATP-dependent helicase [Candidatus Omnitrophica bacterium]|nr:ATP-dependent helicase [Candidatus Omnitrophota bacterium]
MSKSSLLAGLNKSQLAAVTTLDGPVLIVAGAGSGKTKVVTHRVANILREKKDVGCENLLALTFSRKAAEEMRSRIMGLIEVNPEDITISTFHAFCHSVLNEHGIEIGLKRHLRLLDNIDQQIFFKKLMPLMRLKYYGEVTDLAGFSSALLKFISRCKDELVTVSEYGEFVKTIADKDERQRSEEILKAYTLYNDKSLEEGYIDFGDLIIKTIGLFKKSKNILEAYQDRYRYILVDEFQDTNVAQIELISMLASKYKNICVVGDDDQAIYRFRGASYASFIKFKEHFPHFKDIKLTENYRSTKKILKAAEWLIKQNDIDRYDPKKSLWTDNAEGDEIEIMIAPNYNEEAKYIVSKIKEIYAKEGNFSKIAVLYRAHSHKEQLLNLLKTEGIPYSISGGAGIFESPLVKEMIAYINLMADTRDNSSCFRLLSSVDYDIDHSNLTKINIFAKYNNLTLMEALRREKEIELSEEARRQIGKFMSMLKSLKKIYANSGLAEFTYQLINTKTTILKRAFARQQAFGETDLRNVGKCYNLIMQYSNSASGSGITDLADYLETYIDYGGKMESELDSRNDYGVRLMTVHQAKGLEFPYVFIISLVQNRFPTSRKNETVPFPEELIKENLPRGNFHLEEERRLLYVALTRAEKRLFLSGISKSYSKPSVFLEEIIMANQASDITNINLTEPDKDRQDKESIEIPISSYDSISMESASKLARLISKINPDNIDDKDFVRNLERDLKDELKNTLRKIKEEKNKRQSFSEPATSSLPDKFLNENVYSFTQIESYMSCPLKYKYSFVDIIPRRQKPYFSLGTVMHEVLRQFYGFVQQGVPVDSEKLLEIYENCWLSSGYNSKKEERLYKARGRKELMEFYKINKADLIRPLYLEKKFTIELGGRPFKGYIDRIDELEDGKVEIIDYKTGKSEKESTIQLDLYAIAAAEKLGLDVGKLSFYYISTNKKRTFARSFEDLEKTKSKVSDVISKIESGEFQPKLSYMCKFCDYQILCPAYSK